MLQSMIRNGNHAASSRRGSRLALVTDGAIEAKTVQAVQRMRDAIPGTAAILREFGAARAIVQAARICRESLEPLDATPFTPEDASAALHALSEGLGAQALGLAATQVRRDLESVADDLIEELQGDVTGLPTGLPALDARIGGLRPGTLHIIVARSGHGKSCMAATMALRAAEQGHRCLFISREMPRVELALRFVAARRQEPVGMIRRSVHGGNAQVIEELRSALALPIDLDDQEHHIDAIAARVDAEAAKGEPYRVIVFDFFQLFTAEGREQHERFERLAYQMKGLALRSGATVIAPAQPNRVGAKGADLPSMSDIRGSSAIENAADVIISMYRGDAPFEGATYPLILNIEKSRNGQPGGFDSEKFELGAGTFLVTQAMPQGAVAEALS